MPQHVRERGALVGVHGGRGRPLQRGACVVGHRVRGLGPGCRAGVVGVEPVQDGARPVEMTAVQRRRLVGAHQAGPQLPYRLQGSQPTAGPRLLEREQALVAQSRQRLRHGRRVHRREREHLRRRRRCRTAPRTPTAGAAPPGRPGRAGARLHSSVSCRERCRDDVRAPPVSSPSWSDRADSTPVRPRLGTRAAASSIANAIPPTAAQIRATRSSSPLRPARSTNRATASLPAAVTTPSGPGRDSPGRRTRARAARRAAPCW